MNEAAKLNIILVDDDELNLLILTKIVNDEGHISRKFTGGTSAWEYLQANPNSTDLVILDKMMFDMDGLEVMRRMKNHDALKDIPIIIQTGDTDQNQKLEGIALGADHYLIKPYGIGEMLDSINDIIATKHPNRIKEAA